MTNIHTAYPACCGGCAYWEYHHTSSVFARDTRGCVHRVAQCCPGRGPARDTHLPASEESPGNWYVFTEEEAFCPSFRLAADLEEEMKDHYSIGDIACWVQNTEQKIVHYQNGQ